MFSKYILILLFFCVYGGMAISPFFEKGQRPELYELMDNEMPTLKINLPNEEFKSLKKGMEKVIVDPFEQELISKLVSTITTIRYNLKLLKKINYTIVYPGYHLDEIFPQLQIGEDGYAQFDIEEVFSGYDYDPKHYVALNREDMNTIENMVYESNKNFKLREITAKLDDLEKSINDEEYKEMIGNIIIENWERDQINKYINNNFVTKNATMTFEINGNVSSFKKVTFKLAGSFSRFFSKPMYNIKIRNGDELYGRSHFKLRPDMLDPTLIRSKLVSDIRNRIGIPSVSANYVQFYLNDEFMGLYILTDIINLSWIEDVYGDKKSSTLYKCNELMEFTAAYSSGCENKNEDITDPTEWLDFLKTVENAQSASDLEAILDIDHLLYEMAIDYLTNAYDHHTHNFYMYRPPNGKWTYISYDFDNDYSRSIDYTMSDKDYFYDTILGNRKHFYDLFISPNHERFNLILKTLVQEVINPATLFPHIDEIKQFITPYVQFDKTPDAHGNYPGAINKNINEALTAIFHYQYTWEEWDTLSEFYHDQRNAGLKYIILQKYRNICKMLSMACDPMYLDEKDLNEEDFSSSTDRDDDSSYTTKDEIPMEMPTEIYFTEDSTEIPTERVITTTNEPFIEKETVYAVDEPTLSTDEESSFDEEEEEAERDIHASPTSISKSNTIKTITKTQTIIYTTKIN